MAFKMDWTKFKKVSSDKDTTTLRHDDGHTIKIAHKPLSSKMKAELSSLPLHKDGGGQVDRGPVIVKKSAQEAEKGATESGARSLSDYYKNLKEGLGISSDDDKKPSKDNSYDDGGQVDRGPKVDPEGAKKVSQGATESGVRSLSEYAKNIKEGLTMADGGEVPDSQQPQAPVTINIGQPQTGLPAYQPSFQQPQQPQSQGQPIDYTNAKNTDENAPYGTEQMAAQKVANQAQLEQDQQPQQPPKVAPPASMPQAQAGPQGGMMDDYAQNMRGGYNMQMRAADEKKLADQALGQAASDAYGKALGTDQKQIDLSQVANQQFRDDQMKFMQDLQNKHIDPQQFLENKDTGTKVMNALGLFLGGGGAGLSGQPNLAYDFLQKQIDRDINAQQHNIGNEFNLMDHNRQFYGDDRMAREALRVQYNSMYSHMIDQAKAQNMTPQAQAAADQLKGQLMQQNAMILSQAGIGRQGSMDDALQMMRFVNPERAKEMESRYVPGLGMSQIPIPTEARNQIIAQQTFGNMANDLYKWAAKHSGSISPTEMNEGATKAAELQSMYRNAINGGVFKAGEQQFIDKIIDSDPTKFFNNIRVLPKLKEVISSNNQKMGTLLRSYGFQGPQTQQSQGFTPKTFTPMR